VFQRRFVSWLMAVVIFVSFIGRVMVVTAEPTQPDWAIEINGLVESSYNLSYTEILHMPSTIIEAKLYCVDFPDQPVYEGSWKGVQLKKILEKAVLKQGVAKLAFFAGNGFTTDLHLEDALSPDVLIAYELNGRSIEGAKGLPGNRLVVPGQWGYKWIAGIVRIEAVAHDFLGVWESRGYPDKALISQPEPAQKKGSSDPGLYLALVIIILMPSLAVFFYPRQRHRGLRADNSVHLTTESTIRQLQSHQRMPQASRPGPLKPTPSA